jgi:hypothetical protein
MMNKVHVRHAVQPDTPLDREARRAVTECPPPWESLDRGRDAQYRRLVEAHGPELLEEALARPHARSWLLVRYLPEVPQDLVDWSLESHRRECAEFGDLVGARPDLSAANAWAKERRAHRKGKQ